MNLLFTVNKCHPVSCYYKHGHYIHNGNCKTDVSDDSISTTIKITALSLLFKIYSQHAVKYTFASSE